MVLNFAAVVVVKVPLRLIAFSRVHPFGVDSLQFVVAIRLCRSPWATEKVDATAFARSRASLVLKRERISIGRPRAGFYALFSGVQCLEQRNYGRWATALAAIRWRSSCRTETKLVGIGASTRSACPHEASHDTIFLLSAVWGGNFTTEGSSASLARAFSGEAGTTGGGSTE
eukprot:scaffold8097_cov258-Pinguiococcus_pyrenoidosus.AAC.3